MSSPPFRRYIEGFISATTSVAAIYQRSLMAAPFWVPDPDEQREIVRRIEQLFATLDKAELLAVDSATLLHRLFHQENLQELGQRELQFGCSCSRERVAEVLRTLGRDEALAAVEAGNDGEAEIRCEFCGERYHFNSVQIEALFTAPSPNTDAPNRLQ